MAYALALDLTTLLEVILRAHNVVDRFERPASSLVVMRKDKWKWLVACHIFFLIKSKKKHLGCPIASSLLNHTRHLEGNQQQLVTGGVRGRHFLTNRKEKNWSAKHPPPPPGHLRPTWLGRPISIACAGAKLLDQSIKKQMSPRPTAKSPESPESDLSLALPMSTPMSRYSQSS